MTSMFYNCKNLQEINLDSFNTKEVISFTLMFAGCEKLQDLNLSTFDTKTAFQEGLSPANGMFEDMQNLWQLDLGENTRIGLNSDLPSPVTGTALPDESGYIAKSDKWQAVADGTDHEPTGNTYSPIDLAFLTQDSGFTGGRFVWEQTFPVEPEPEPEPEPDPNPGPNPTPGPNQPETSTPETSTPQPAPSPQPTPTPAPTPGNPETPATTPGQNEATTKQQVVYAVKGLYLYQRPTFSKGQRLVRYPKQKRISRPMFIVTGYARSANGALRYKVRDINRTRRTFGKVGYVTANDSYVKPAYYQTLSKSRRVTVIATKGVNAYRTRNLTGKVSHYKRGRQLRVKKLVKSGLTTRYQLTNGRYISGNKLLVIQQN